MEGFSSDIWQLISRWLAPGDLCSMMQCSRCLFEVFVTDRSWRHQRDRLCCEPGVGPLLQQVFELCKKKSNAKRSKRNGGLSIPRSGTWFVFAHRLSCGFTMPGLKQLCRKPRLQPLVIAVAMISLPLRSQVVETNMVSYPATEAFETMHRIVVRYERGNYFQCSIRNGRYEMAWMVYVASLQYHFYDATRYKHNVEYFYTWHCFVRQKWCAPCWTDLLVEHMSK